MVTQALVTPRLVRWARQRYYTDLNVAAEDIGVPAEKLAAWESGEARPSFPQALKLAHRLNVPFGYLYLERPPEEGLPLPDLRTVWGAQPERPSPEFLDVLYDALRKQEWFKQELTAEGTEPLPFVGRFNGAAPTQVAADIRTTLAINAAFRQQARSWEEFLTRFVQQAEAARIMVLRSSYAGSNTRRHLNVTEFRGFAISDRVAPLVFVNSADAKAAQIFTLAHELAHLWVGQSGISNPDYLAQTGTQRHEIDRHCDAIAAEVLVPAVDIRQAWEDNETLDQNLEVLVRRYRVSRLVVLRRARDIGKVAEAAYREKFEALLEESAERRRGGTFYPTFIARNSAIFTTTLVTAQAEGRVSPKEAATLLNVHIATLPNIERQMMATG